MATTDFHSDLETLSFSSNSDVTDVSNISAMPITPITPADDYIVSSHISNICSANSNESVYNFNHDEINRELVTDDIFYELKCIKLKNPKNIVITHVNINSIRNKFSELRLILDRNIVDILVITETKVDASFTNTIFMVPNYKLYRLDNTAKSGGVFIYVCDNIPSTQSTVSIKNKQLQCLSVKLTFDGYNLFMMGMYKNPKMKNDDFEQQFGNLLENVIRNHDSEYMLLGDLNFDMSDPNCFLHSLCDRFCLTNVINQATCFKSISSPSTVDLVLVSKRSLFFHPFAVDINLSDVHYMVGLFMRKFLPAAPKVYKTIRSYKHINYDHVRRDLSRIKFSETFNVSANACELYSNFLKSLKNILDKHAPLKTIHVKTKRIPFMTPSLRKAILQRNMFRKKFFKQRSTPNFAFYRKARNRVNIIKRQEMNQFINKSCSGGPTKGNFWKTLKPFFNRKGSVRNKIMLKKNNDIINNPDEICHIFNDYFANIGNDIGNNDDETLRVEEIVTKYSQHTSIQQIKKHLAKKFKGKEPDSFSFRMVTAKEVHAQIMCLKTNKATGFDDISASFIKQISGEISVPLTKIINECIWQGIFPKDMKKANISPIYKKKDSLLVENYRSISILPVLSKIFEKILHQQMYGYFKCIFHKLISGFRTGYSCNYILLKLTEDMKKALDQKFNIGLVAMDLSKAFDIIPRYLFIAKLSAYGFSSNACELIHSYLSDRHQRVKINDNTSNWTTTCKGVAQGSIIGPLVFNIFMNDFFYVNFSSQIYNYADDNTLGLIHNSYISLKTKLEVDTKLAVDWFECNYMQANPEKFQVMLLGKGIPQDASINVCGSEIKSSKTLEILGIILDNKLKFDQLINEICRKTSQQINVLSRLRNKLDFRSRVIIYNSFILSNLSYCSTVWMHCGHSNVKKLEKINERAMRFVNNDLYSIYDVQLQKSGKLTLLRQRLITLGIDMFKVHLKLTPDYIYEMFTYVEILYNLRATNTLCLMKFDSMTYGHRSFNYMGAKLWNSFSNEMRNCTNINTFKTLLTNFVTNSNDLCVASYL